MTDAPSSYDEIFPALDGTNNNNISTNSVQSSLLNNSNTDTLTNSWSAQINSQVIGQGHNQQNQQAKQLNYLQQIQHLYQQRQQQQQQQQKQQQQQQQLQHHSHQSVLDHLVNSTVSQIQNLTHQRDQQQLKQQETDQTQALPNLNNNIISNTEAQTMQNNSAPQKRPLQSDKCSTFKITPEERRHRDFELEQSKILKEIMQQTNTKIEVTTTRDGALNFCIVGKPNLLPVAKQLVLNNFQAPITLTVSVPKAVHGRLLGSKGQRLSQIQDETHTNISVPRKEEDSDVIKIVGLKNNAELAVRSIEKYAREFANKAVEKVSFEKIYLLFITGPFNENLKRWEEMGTKVSILNGQLPITSNQQDEVSFTITGETKTITTIKEEILQIYEDKKKKCTTVSMEVKKAQHKYIIGSNSQNLRQLFSKTGVSVEMPSDNNSETITLRGERSKIGPALSVLYTQAHSETDDYFEVESWLHKYLTKKSLIDFKTLGVDVKSVEDKIKLHGPPSEIENIKDIFEAELENIRKTIVRKDIKVEPRIHGYIIGKSGLTVDQIREESGAWILVPKNDEPSEFITLEGTQEAVDIAEKKILAIAKRYEATRTLAIDQQLHGSIIGRGGEKIRSIREKFSQVIFTFPEQGSRHNEITIVGPTDEVEECLKYLEEFHEQLKENNHQVQVTIREDVVKYLSDAQAPIRRIKVDNRVKIDLFLNDKNTTDDIRANSVKQQQTNAKSEAKVAGDTESESVNESKVGKKSGKNKTNKKQPQSNGVPTKTEGHTRGDNYAVIIGKKEDVDQAKVKFSKLLEELATTTEIEVKMPHKLKALLGHKTKAHRQFLDDFQQKIVLVFPQDKRSSKNDESSNTNGAVGGKNNKAIKEDNNNNKDSVETVKIRGPKAIAKKAEKRFETLLTECQDRVDKGFSTQVNFDAAILEKFKYPDKMKLNKIRDTYNVKLTLTERRDGSKNQCNIIGYEKDVQNALKEFNKLLKDVEERVEETIEISSQVHPRLIGAQGRAVKKLMEDFKIEVKFARQGDPNPDSVKLTGRAECVKAAKNHMIKLADHYLAAASRASNNGNSMEGGNMSHNSHQQQEGSHMISAD